MRTGDALLTVALLLLWWAYRSWRVRSRTRSDDAPPRMSHGYDAATVERVVRLVTYEHDVERVLTTARETGIDPVFLAELFTGKR
jgi:hypothetical protein